MKEANRAFWGSHCWPRFGFQRRQCIASPWQCQLLARICESEPAATYLFMQVCWLNQARRFASCWQVSSCGRVQSTKGVISCGSRVDDGYRRVKIGGVSYFVHRLVASAFLGPWPDAAQWQVNHIDRNRENNHKENLQYVTPSDNIRHARARDTGQARKQAARHGKPVLWREGGHQSWSFEASRTDAARAAGVSAQSVSRCCSGVATSCTVRLRNYEFKNGDAADVELLPDEVWRDAVHAGDEGTISNLWVSNFGRVRSATRVGTQMVSYGHRTVRGYFTIKKSDRSYKVHRLVAGTFLGHPASPSMQVNHKDMNRGNNHVQNLEYVTQSQNMRHALTQLREQWRNVGGCKPVQARVAGLDGAWIPFESIRAAAAYTGIRPASVSAACKGEVRGCNPPAWEFRFLVEEPLPGEEWRPVVLEGARVPPSRA